MKIKNLSLLVALLFQASLAFSQWTYVSSTGTTFILYGMSFPPNQSAIGYACGMQYTYDADGVIVKTTDGGNNWTQIWPSSGSIDGLQGIWFTSDLVGFACGWNNYFIKTTDGGATWAPISVGTDVWYYTDVEFWDVNNGIAVASMNNPGNQAAFITSDGGNTWAPSTSGLGTNEVMGISYATQNTVFAVGTGSHVFKSTDGGHNWTLNNTLSAMLLGVDFANATFGVAGGEETMFATNNGASTWTSYFTGYEFFYATLASPDGIGYLGGTDEHIYKTTNYGQTWTLDNGGSGYSSLYRIRKTANGTLFACGSQGTILKWAPPLEADFIASPTTVCTGGTVNFTDNSTGTISSWSWTFEGGTPPASALQNPVVTYNTPGVYDVSLTVTGSTGDATEIKTDYITVYGTLVAPEMPAGPDEVCGTYSYQYITQPVTYAEDYDWVVSPASAGTMTGNDVVGTFIASNNWFGSYTIKVRAANDCGDGPWSPEFTGTLHTNPIVYDLLGDGTFCEGSDGAEITLSDSDNGVSYELFKDNVTTGIIITGTGNPVSFGYYTETGLYTATGYTNYCSESMVGQIYVHMEPVPGQAATPDGPSGTCNNETSSYSTAGATFADSYLWSLSPEEAGILTSNGDEATIAWSSGFTGTAYLSVTGFNDCGTGIPSEDLLIDVNPVPAPAISGAGQVCDNTEENYNTDENPGSTYNWEVIGGEVTTGAGTSQVTILWGNPGNGSVSVFETNEAGCTDASETLLVTIDDCTGVDEETEHNVIIYPNPASDKLHISGLDNATISIYNILGELVMKHQQANGRKIISLSSLEKGLYLVKVEQRKGLTVLRLLKD